MCSTFTELCSRYKDGADFAVFSRGGVSGIGVMAPHGGGIEPGTTELADAIAGWDHAYYSFSGLKAAGNLELHITSHLFDEPEALAIAGGTWLVVAIHGCAGRNEAVYAGGLAVSAKERIAAELESAGFTVGECAKFPGAEPQNICNRCRTGMGVQLEITAGLREKMFEDLSARGRPRPGATFRTFVEAVRQALRFCESPGGW
jgi:phage replication-related protein YjqB (UPF0714/DUF867 family)